MRGLVLVGALLLASCAAPVVTRIDTAMPGARPVSASFVVADVPGDVAPVQQDATGLVVQSLAQRGWTISDSADVLLSVTLSDRPAQSQLLLGDDYGKPAGVIGPAPTRSNNRGCARRDQRLTVTLAHRATGDLIYSGAASEYHCKAGLEQNLPALVAAALDGMDNAPGVRQVERAALR